MNTCPIHNRPLAPVGRMNPDDAMEYACDFCMNDFDPDVDCSDKDRDRGKCAGELQLWSSGYSDVVMVKCERHAVQAYERNDRIRAEYR